MRHAIIVVGSEDQRGLPAPELAKQGDDNTRVTTWYACLNQESPAKLLDDAGSLLWRILLVPLLAYRFYLLVHNTKLWSGRRPLILIRGRSLSSRIAAYAGDWGGGDVVMPSESGESLLEPTRYLLLPDGNLELRKD